MSSMIVKLYKGKAAMGQVIPPKSGKEESQQAEAEQGQGGGISSDKCLAHCLHKPRGKKHFFFEVLQSRVSTSSSIIL